MEDYENIEQIEKYLTGTLEGKALVDFELRLRTDKSLAEQLSIIKNMDLALEDERAIALQKTTGQLGEVFFSANIETEKKTVVKKIPFYKRPIAMAASFLLLVSIGFLLWSTAGKKNLTNTEIFATYYQTYPANINQRGADPDKDLFEQGLIKYQAKSYKESIKILEEVVTADATNMEAKFYLGHAYLSHRPPLLVNAQAHFTEIIGDGKSILVEKSKWNLTLINLHQNNTRIARIFLNELKTTTDSKLKKQVTELLKAIE